MENFYKILEIKTTASNAEVKRALHEALRLWSNRTNAPQIDQRHKAEHMIKLLEEAEAILLNPDRRAEYDDQLEIAPHEDSEKPEIENSDSADEEIDSAQEVDEETEPKNSRISEAVIQAKFDKSSTLNSPSFGWSVILCAILLIAWNVFRWMPFLKSTP
jgi:curved DNA-binding protein CbpA